jgi:dephospho-CoA kinase
MKVIGLTGGIATGKSTVAAMLRELGATVIDSDEGARTVVEPGTTGFGQVVAEFGPAVVREGRIDRTRLGEIVFADDARRRRLEEIVWPLVRAWTAERIGEAAERGVDQVVLDIPLLYETGRTADFATVILVYAPEQLQVQRLRARSGLSEAQARARIAAQLPIEEKRKLAAQVIDNSGSPEATRAQVERVWAEITAARGSGP